MPAPKDDNTEKAQKALEDRIARGAKGVRAAIEKRQAANDEKNAIRSDLQNAGISKKAFDAALRIMEMDPQDRRGFDIAYNLCRKALGSPIDGQIDLVQWLEEQDEAKAQGVDETGRTAKHRAENGGD